jgi:adenylate kinase family enzyme
MARALAERLQVPLVELDALMHQPGWVPKPDVDFTHEVDQVTAQDNWVVDGNYKQVVTEGPVWQRADTVVWMDPPRRTFMRQLLIRTVRRAVTREVLWNANREPLTNFTSLDPDRNVFVWAWITHQGLTERYAKAMADPRWEGINFVRLRSNAEAGRWLSSVNPTV